MKTIESEKKDALKLAKELCYSEEVKNKIKVAKNITQIDNALAYGRKNKGVLWLRNLERDLKVS